MANRLTMAQILSIDTLLKTGHSQRRVATLLEIDRETVGKYARQLQGQTHQLDPVQNQPNAPTGKLRRRLRGRPSQAGHTWASHDIESGWF